jgi:hypothetical protein
LESIVSHWSIVSATSDTLLASGVRDDEMSQGVLPSDTRSAEDADVSDNPQEKFMRRGSFVGIEEARQRWLYEESQTTEEEEQLRRAVESTYQKAWDRAMDSEELDEPLTSEQRVIVGERLALLLLQSPGDGDVRWRAADAILRSLGFRCRLSRPILDYHDHCMEPPSQSLKSLAKSQHRNPMSSLSGPPCRILDSILAMPELERLQQVFLDPSASYWTSQDYRVEPPSPYVSYLIPLPESNLPGGDGAVRADAFVQQYGALGSVILRVLDKIQDWRPAVVQQATACELWAHNRPNPTGHQLHFDSDNEGLGSIRHPMATAILCLSHDPARIGGAAAPTLLTNQRLVSRYPSDKGWLAFPRANRLILMDGRVLHGVVPGKRLAPALCGAHSRRRVTLMLAFWKRIRVRDEPTPGAARPFPLGVSRARPPWSEALTRPVPRTVHEDGTAPECSEAHPVAVSHVYESVTSGQPWDRSMGMPSYDEVFQGL